MKLTDRLSASSDVVSREVGGATILLDLASGTYFGLDPVGARIWTLIEEAEGLTLTQVCDAIFEDFEVPREELEHDVLALAGKLSEQHLAASVGA